MWRFAVRGARALLHAAASVCAVHNLRRPAQDSAAGSYVGRVLQMDGQVSPGRSLAVGHATEPRRDRRHGPPGGADPARARRHGVVPTRGRRTSATGGCVTPVFASFAAEGPADARRRLGADGEPGFRPFRHPLGARLRGGLEAGLRRSGGQDRKQDGEKAQPADTRSGAALGSRLRDWGSSARRPSPKLQH